MFFGNQMTAGLAILAITVVAAGCSGPVQPSTSPSNVAQNHPAPPPPPFTISGVVTGRGPTGPGPLAGAKVHDQYTHRSATTGPDGSYSLSGLDGAVIVDVTLAGYERYETEIILHGDLRLDIELTPAD